MEVVGCGELFVDFVSFEEGSDGFKKLDLNVGKASEINSDCLLCVFDWYVHIVFFLGLNRWILFGLNVLEKININ